MHETMWNLAWPWSAQWACRQTVDGWVVKPAQIGRLCLSWRGEGKTLRTLFWDVDWRPTKVNRADLTTMKRAHHQVARLIAGAGLKERVVQRVGKGAALAIRSP